nr:uncharacterized protein LOC105323885 [Crassostrea gigas]
MCAAPDVGLRPGYCGPGYFGLFCGDICPYPYYGKLCDYTCSCSKKYCSHVNGCIRASSCPSGFIGSSCESKCTFPSYGVGCQQTCLCTEAVCNFSTGCQRKIVNRQTVSSMKSLPIIGGTTNERLLIPKSNSTIWTPAQSAAVSSQTLSSLKAFTINKETTNEILMTPMSNTTIWTQTQTAETTREASLECKTMHLKTKQRGTGKSSGLFSFSENRGIKASLGVLCILFIWLVIAHIFLFIVQRIKVNSNPIPV